MSIAKQKQSKKQSGGALLQLRLGVSLTSFTKGDARKVAKDVADLLKILPR